ncbi:MAG: TonB-dependent receptor plug domain-containing protein [Bacteroidota bacterium]
MNKLLTLILLLCNSSAAGASDTAVVQQDSVIYILPIAELGSIEPYGDSTRIIGKDEIIWNEYRSLYDILAGFPGVFIRDLASPGQKNQIVINGIDDNYIAILVDGIPYNDYPSSSFNLWNIPVDMIERVEIITGPGSFFHDGRSSGGVINIVTKSFTNNRAITNLRYSQGVDGYVHTDAMFAQNIFRDFNLTLGLSHYGYGTNKERSRFRGRFYNSNDDAWTFRVKMRYNVTNDLNVSFTHLANRSMTGLHGGVDYLITPAIFDGYLATVQNFDAYEKLFYNQSYLTVAFAPGSDSAGALTVSGYYFDRLRQYRDEENRSTANGIFQQSDFYSITRGVRVNYFHHTKVNRLSVNYNLNERKSGTDITVESFGIRDQLTILNFLDVTGYASYTKEISYGGEASMRLMDGLSLYAGYSRNSGPTLADRFLRNDEMIEQSAAGVRYTLPGFFAGAVNLSKTAVHNMIVYDTIPNTNVLTSSSLSALGRKEYDAVSMSGHLMFGEFHVEGTAVYLIHPRMVRDNMAATLQPELTMNGSVYYHGLLAKGNLDLKIGVRGWYVAKQTGMKPYDELGLWIPSSLLAFGPSGTMDFFAVGKIGSAYVHLIWENLTGNQYLLAPVYPMYERNIRFGLSWEFLN